MNEKELAQLEKKAVFTMRADPTIKDQVVISNINRLNKEIKARVRSKNVVIFLFEN